MIQQVIWTVRHRHLIVVRMERTRRTIRQIFQAVLLHLKFEIVLILVLCIRQLSVDFDCGNGPTRLIYLSLGLRLLLCFVRKLLTSARLLKLTSPLKPGLENVGAGFLHTVVREEDGGHGVEQILVIVQVFLVLDEFEFELVLQVLVLERLIGIQICEDVVEQVVGLGCQRVLHVRQRVLWLPWVVDSIHHLLLVAGVEVDWLELLLHWLRMLDRHHLALMQLVVAVLLLLVVLLVLLDRRLMVQYFDVRFLDAAALALLADAPLSFA